jgi:hypothetical protein
MADDVDIPLRRRQTTGIKQNPFFDFSFSIRVFLEFIIVCFVVVFLSNHHGVPKDRPGISGGGINIS